MSHRSSSSSDAPEPRTRVQPPAGQSVVTAPLERLRDVFGGDAQDGVQSSTQQAPLSSVNTANVLYPFGPDITRLQSSPIDLDHRSAVGGFYTSATATPTQTAEAAAHAPPATSTAEAGGASETREYFRIPPPSPPSHNSSSNNSDPNNNNTNNSNSTSTGVSTGGGGPLFSPLQDVTNHAVETSCSGHSDGVQASATAGGAGTAQAPPPQSLCIPPPPVSHSEGERPDGGPHARSSSESSTDLSPPRSPARRLTAEEEQLARLRAYNAMSGTDASGARDGCSTGDSTVDNKRSFFVDTIDTLLPNGMTRWFSHSADVVAQQSSSAVPESVKHAASVAANKIGSGAQQIGGVIEHVPELMVNAIPTAIMSEEVKRLLFTDFSNTFRSFFHTNILSMPFIIRQAGLVGGIFLLTFVAITSEYATEAYFGAKNQMKKAHTVILYGDVQKMVWGRWYPMINIFYGVTHLIGFIAFSASNSVVLLGAMGMKGGGARALGLIIPSLIALPLVLMKNAQSQEPLSIMSNLLVFTAVILMFVDFPYTPTRPIKLWPSSATEFFVAMGVSVYAFTGIGSAIPVERVMPARRYRKLLRASVAIAYAILMAFGLSGFLSYGNHTCSVMTVSLQKGPLRTAVSALLFFASIMIIPQQTFPLCELSDRRLLGITRLTTYWDLKPNIMRIMYLVVSAFAAFIVPYYGLLLSISGALGCGIVGLVVPAALDYVRRERKGLHHGRTMRFYEYLIVFGLGFYGCVVVVIGVVSGSYQLWMSIQTRSTDSC